MSSNWRRRYAIEPSLLKIHLLNAHMSFCSKVVYITRTINRTTYEIVCEHCANCNMYNMHHTCATPQALKKNITRALLKHEIS